jgi:hypothetical protein
MAKLSQGGNMEIKEMAAIFGKQNIEMIKSIVELRINNKCSPKFDSIFMRLIGHAVIYQIHFTQYCSGRTMGDEDFAGMAHEKADEVEADIDKHQDQD